MRRWLAVAAAALVLLGAGVAGAWYWNERQTGDVEGSSTQEFVVTEEPGAPEEEEPTVSAPETETEPEPEPLAEPWPEYRYADDRTGVAPYELRPPFRRLWVVRGRSLIEFPPVVGYGRLYVGTNPGRFIAADTETGRIEWEKDFGLCIAASAAVANGIVYVPLMDPSPCATHDQDAPGFLVALDAETGEERWRFRAGVVESSPLIARGLVVFGAWDGKVYALDARTGRRRWSFQTGDKVKSGVAVRGGLVYAGSYDGHLYALELATGKLRWRAEGQGGLVGGVQFYATPAVAYGRVFVGGTDGKVYAFGARTGDLIWSQSTGDYVYSSAAVWEQTVYVGSYDHRFYALDAATGDVRWRFDARGPISGSPTVLAGLVYFATLRPERTYALDARTGREVWRFGDGKYTPVVADEERVYLTGLGRVYALEPRS